MLQIISSTQGRATSLKTNNSIAVNFWEIESFCCNVELETTGAYD